MFHEAMLVAPRERYAQEGIQLDDGAEEGKTLIITSPSIYL